MSDIPPCRVCKMSIKCPHGNHAYCLCTAEYHINGDCRRLTK